MPRSLSWEEFRVIKAITMNFNNYNNNNKRFTRKRKSKRVRNQRNDNQIVRLTQPGRFASDRLYAILRYNDTTFARSAPATSDSMNWRYRSSAFDPDPLILSGAIPGFVELANLYNFYRVEKMVAQAEFNNQETEATIVAGWPSTNDNNNNSLSSSDVVEYGSNVHGTNIMLGNGNGQGRGRLSVTADLMQLVGPNGFTDLDYSSDTSTNPVVVYYINFGTAKTIGNYSFAMPTKVTIDYHLCFYKLRQLES